MNKYLLLLLLPSLVMARDFPEKHYQEQWCKGEVEHVLPDRARVDCLTDEYAIEFDFADKADQALGQALRYSAATNKKPGIVLIVEKEKDYRYVLKLYNTLQHHSLKIKVWVIRP